MFANKVVAITGAGSGIGRALALQFGRAGARLALSDINPTALAATQALLPDGTDARSYVVDVSDQASVFSHAHDVQRDFGSAHVIINNAGAMIAGTVENTSIDEYRWQLDINLYGVLYGTKAFLPMMLAQKEGHIVNVSSVFGFLAYPAHSAYNMSKFAVSGLTECLWSELDGTGVQAVCVHPGSIKTDIGKTARFAKQAGIKEQRILEALNKKMVVTADQCAAEIISGLRQGKQRIVTGDNASAAHWMKRLLPDSYPKVLKWLG